MVARVSNIWTVPAIVLRVVDGDTLMLRFDLGWHISYESRARLIGVNAPELSTEDGVAARVWVTDWMADVGGDSFGAGAEVTFVSHALDKYGRPLGQVLATTPQGASRDLGLDLLTAGHAVPMAG
jgi:endonuclease YncB( thermonuclease family)